MHEHKVLINKMKITVKVSARPAVRADLTRDAMITPTPSVKRVVQTTAKGSVISAK